MTFPAKACVIDGNLFVPQRSTDLTCSMDCSIQLRRRRSRESVARRYVPRPQRQDSICEGCGVRIPAPKSGPLRKWCEPCRTSKVDARMAERIAVRRCYKCGVELPNAKRQPGKAVCSECRVDPRQRASDHEHRRRLRRYGITQEQYDVMFAQQGGRCAGCHTTEPGAKGWCIDHCHESGVVRWIFCHGCNSALGLVAENSATLRRLADLIDGTNRD